MKDGYGYAAVFEELSVSPACMEAGKVCGMWGISPGNTIQSADGEQAYCQAELSGLKTYIRNPRSQWPQSWHDKNLTDPLVRLNRALYGHPDAGGFWEMHCEKAVK